MLPNLELITATRFQTGKIDSDEDSRLSVKDNKSDSEQFSNTSVESVSMVEAVQSSRSQRNEATAQRKVSINKNKITVCISNQKEEEKLLERKKTSMQTARNMILFHLGIRRPRIKDLIDENTSPGLVFDTHCHYEFIQKRMSKIVSLSECLKLDGEELGDKFVGCIVNYCQPSEWSGGEDHDQLSSLLLSSASDARVGIAIGCHPHFADQMTEQKWKQFESLISKDEYPNLSIVAVGECGLDNSRKNSVPKIIQFEVFKRQLMLALKYNLPLVLHIRDAMQDGLEVLESVGVPQDYPIHLHCFTSSLEVAHKWLNKYSECKIGFTGRARNGFFGTLRLT